jgi:hypothetical protein
MAEGRAGIVSVMSEKDDLLAYLQRGREAVVGKVESAGEYDVRRPLTPTGTNLLGLLKHLAGVEAGYLGQVFGRPFPEPIPWAEDDAELESDMWATPEEPRADLVALYRRVWAHGDETVAALDLETTGLVRWWPEERRYPTLHRVLVHLTAEIHRHAGHADIVRELVDGSAGLLPQQSSLGSEDPAHWAAHRARVQAAAEAAAGR